MLGNKKPMATIAVRNLDAARSFYEGRLGLMPDDHQEPGTVSYRSGDASLLVYPSQYAGSNLATAVTWTVGEELDETVRTLKSRGVVFEQYDFPDMVRDGDVHVMGPMRVAWFKDLDRNIHALVNG